MIVKLFGRGTWHDVLIDDEDMHLFDVKGWNVVVRGGGGLYVYNATIGLYLHRAIMKPSEGFVVDHIDGSTLDNRRSNLRVVTHAQNMQNRKKIVSTSSRFHGVSWSEHAKKWRCVVNLDRKQIQVGYFKDEVEAATAYNAYIDAIKNPFKHRNKV